MSYTNEAIELEHYAEAYYERFNLDESNDCHECFLKNLKGELVGDEYLYDHKLEEFVVLNTYNSDEVAPPKHDECSICGASLHSGIWAKADLGFASAYLCEDCLCDTWRTDEEVQDALGIERFNHD